MPLVPTADIVARAVAARTAAVAFNVLHLETAEALAAAAESAGSPLILGISENCIRYHGGLEPVTAATLAVANASSADLSVHLDHLTDPELVRRGVAAGVSSVAGQPRAVARSARTRGLGFLRPTSMALRWV